MVKLQKSKNFSEQETDYFRMYFWSKIVSKIAFREMRGGLKGFRVLIACLAIGVAAIAGVGSLSKAIKTGLENDSRRLLGGDISLRLTHRPVSLSQRNYLEETNLLSEVVERRSMALSNKNDRPVLVELKAVDVSYPLVGEVKFEGGGNLTTALAIKAGLWGALVERSLVTKLNIGLGDHIEIGEGKFRISGFVDSEPDRNVWSLGPRVMVSSASLKETELIKPGSQVRFRYRILLPPNQELSDWVQKLETKFPSAGWRIRSKDQAAPGLQRFIDYISLFLTFAGLAALLVGGIGVSNGVESYLDSKVATIAILKSIGSSGTLILCTYMVQVFLLASIGIAVGLALGALFPIAGGWALKELLPIKLINGIFIEQLIFAALFGFLVTFIFSFWPLAKARSIPVANLFRQKASLSNFEPDIWHVMPLVISGCLLIFLTIWTAVDKVFAAWFVIGCIASLCALTGCARLLKKLAKIVNVDKTTELRLALNNLYRPGASTNGIVLSLGLAVLTALILVQSNLDRQVNQRLPDLAPAFFLIDIQKSQVERIDKKLKTIDGVTEFRRVPSLRGRIVKIAGRPVEKTRIAAAAQWAVRGDRALTYSAHLPEGGRLVTGNWWAPNYAGPPIISLDANLARGFGVGVGDTLTLNILGREVEAEIVNLRDINWRLMKLDFAIMFGPGFLENAPHTYLATIKATRSAQLEVEKIISQAFKNISIISVREALQTAAKLLSGIGRAV
ncbi:MAG: ABC transporter permease, partial [Pseudomonadota bacterium]|nr:ABC transporter permease [Pseudomonadota bacterium]